MNHFTSSILRNLTNFAQSRVINQCLHSQISPKRWINLETSYLIDNAWKSKRIPVTLLPLYGRYTPCHRYLSQDKNQYPRSRRKSMSERTKVMADKTKEMSQKTRLRIRETRAVVKDKLEGMRENIMTYPNGLSVMRIMLTPIMGYCILEHHHVTALSIFVVAGVSDLLDGYIARTFPSQKSVLGSVLDPVADKFLVATSFVTLTMDSLIPVALTVLIIARDLVLVGWSAFFRYQSLHPPKTIGKFFDLSMPTAEIKPTFISKVNTVLQLSLICTTLASPIFSNIIYPEYLETLWWTTAATTLFSGIGYLSMRGSYRVIKRGTSKEE